MHSFPVCTLSALRGLFPSAVVLLSLLTTLLPPTLSSALPVPLSSLQVQQQQPPLDPLSDNIHDKLFETDVLRSMVEWSPGAATAKPTPPAHAESRTSTAAPHDTTEATVRNESDFVTAASVEASTGQLAKIAEEPTLLPALPTTAMATKTITPTPDAQEDEHADEEMEEETDERQTYTNRTVVEEEHNIREETAEKSIEVSSTLQTQAISSELEVEDFVDEDYEAVACDLSSILSGEDVRFLLSLVSLLDSSDVRDEVKPTESWFSWRRIADSLACLVDECRMKKEGFRSDTGMPVLQFKRHRRV